MSKKFVLTLYTVQQLSDSKTMKTLWQLLDMPIISPKKYDSVERVKIPFQPDSFEAATELYEDVGMLFVRGGKDGFLAFFSKERQGLSIWRIYLSISAMQESKKMERWLAWIFTLCGRLPVLYGYGCSEEEVDAKHEYVKEYPDGGRSIGAIGMSVSEFYQYLPGLYWLTIFGAELVQAFDQTRFGTLPDVSTYVLDAQQVAIRLNEPLLPEDMGQRLKAESQLADILGAKFFFDRNRTDIKFEPVPALVHALNLLASRETQAEPVSTPESAPEEELQRFENQIALSANGVPYKNLGDVAETLVVYLHTEVKEIFAYSRSALVALDTYFAEHPQALEYSSEYLLEEFIPALGAYLGEVFVRQLGGEWIKQDPLLKSVVKVKEKEIPVFRIAYQVVYGDAKLVEKYDSIS